MGTDDSRGVYRTQSPVAVAEYTDADCDQSTDDVAAYAQVADRLFDREIVYVEYSGSFGDPAVVEAAANACCGSTLFYGGRDPRPGNGGDDVPVRGRRRRSGP